MPARPFVWLITGTSTGIGREVALAALKRGDHVIAAARARSISKLDGLQSLGAHVLELDVTCSINEMNIVVGEVMKIHGRIDVLVNNAGYGHIGAVEEFSLEETMQQFNTNLFGGLNLTRAFLPCMRQERTGTIVWIGSITPWSAIPGTGLYAASKAAVRALSEVLDAEVSSLGIRSIDVEFGFTRTEGINNMILSKSGIDDYRALMDPSLAGLQGFSGKEPVDAAKGAEILVDLVKGEGCAEGRKVPPVVGIGADWLEAVTAYCKGTLERSNEWKSVTLSADFPPASSLE